MHKRSTAVLFTLTIAGASAIGGIACSGSRYQPPPNAARSQTPPALPQEVTSPSGIARTPGDHGGATHAPTPVNNNSAASPPPSAGTSTPLPNSPSAPFKPGSSEQPPSTGGGPKSETGGAVYGDGNEGNTGAIKGGDPSAPPKQ